MHISLGGNATDRIAWRLYRSIEIPKNWMSFEYIISFSLRLKEQQTRGCFYRSRFPGLTALREFNTYCPYWAPFRRD